MEDEGDGWSVVGSNTVECNINMLMRMRMKMPVLGAGVNGERSFDA